MPDVGRFEVWLANLNPQRGTEVGKVRPVLVVQSNLLNEVHPSTLICPITTNIIESAEVLRVRIAAGKAGLDSDSDVIIDQIRAIDNKRLIERVGMLPIALRDKVKFNLKVVLDLGW